jgi:hypothetical protein
VIQTVHGRGYRFIATLAVEESEASAERAAATTSRLPLNPARNAPTTVVGRNLELDKLSALLQRALGGAATFAFVAGESGVGKTTLVNAFASGRCETVHARVLRGQCSSEVDVTEPYLPLIDALRSATRSAFANDVDRVLRTRAPSCGRAGPSGSAMRKCRLNVAASPRLSLELTDALAHSPTTRRPCSCSKIAMGRSVDARLAGLATRRAPIAPFDRHIAHWCRSRDATSHPAELCVRTLPSGPP